MSVVIKVENLSKYYRLGVIGGGTLREDLSRWWALKRGKPDPLLSIGEEDHGNRKDGQIWALQDVNFEVEEGEILGIIGRNGAGKSTLLKILSRITAPTAGRVKIRGRVASLLEVGTGFHPQLTGRENIFLNGTILGMSRKEVSSKLEEIVEFAEMSKFIDTPVKRYSSGMTVRLAFAVAAHLEPEILIIDEVLAVGDHAFQKKCLGKMEQVSGEGRTVLFVSHNMQTIGALTKKCLLLSEGGLVFDGETNAAIDAYLAFGLSQGSTYVNERTTDCPSIKKIEIETSKSNSIQEFGKPMRIRFHITTPHPIADAALSFQVLDSNNVAVTHLLLLDSEIEIGRTAGDYMAVCDMDKVRLYPGNYHLLVHFAEGRKKNKLETIDRACQFEVVNHSGVRDYYWRPGAAKYIEDASWCVKSDPNLRY